MNPKPIILLTARIHTLSPSTDAPSQSLPITEGRLCPLASPVSTVHCSSSWYSSSLKQCTGRWAKSHELSLVSGLHSRDRIHSFQLHPSKQRLKKTPFPQFLPHQQQPHSFNSKNWMMLQQVKI